jgi:hypothetical protein
MGVKLGKLQRQRRRERMRWYEDCRDRVSEVANPDVNAAACSGKTRLCTDNLVPFNRSRVPAGWNSHVARVSSHKLGKVYS